MKRFLVCLLVLLLPVEPLSAAVKDARPGPVLLPAWLDRDAAASLVAPLVVRPRPEVLRSRAAQALGALGGHASAAALAGALGSAEPPLALVLVRALGTAGEPGAATVLAARLADAHALYVAAGDLALLDPATRWPERLQLMTEEVRALAILDPRLALHTLTEAAIGRPLPAEAAKGNLAEAALELRLAAVKTLAVAGGPQALRVLVTLLGDPLGELRFSVALALGRLGDPAAYPILSAVSRSDPDPQVRRAARLAVTTLGLPR